MSAAEACAFLKLLFVMLDLAFDFRCLGIHGKLKPALKPLHITGEGGGIGRADGDAARSTSDYHIAGGMVARHPAGHTDPQRPRGRRPSADQVADKQLLSLDILIEQGFLSAKLGT